MRQKTCPACREGHHEGCLGEWKEPVDDVVWVEFECWCPICDQDEDNVYEQRNEGE